MGIVVLVGHHPFKRGMVGDQLELPAQQVILELLQYPFLFYGGVVWFVFWDDGMFYAVLNLEENGSQAGIRGICLQRKFCVVRGGEDRKAAEAATQGLKGDFCLRGLGWVDSFPSSCEGALQRVASRCVK